MTYLLKWASTFTLSMLLVTASTTMVAMQKDSSDKPKSFFNGTMWVTDYSKLSKTNSSVFGGRSVWGYPHGEPLGTNVTSAECAAAKKKLQTRAAVGVTVTAALLAWPKLKHLVKR